MKRSPVHRHDLGCASDDVEISNSENAHCIHKKEDGDRGFGLTAAYNIIRRLAASLLNHVLLHLSGVEMYG